MIAIERKQELRKYLLKQRRMMDKKNIEDKSKKICEFLCSWPSYLAAKTVMLFLSMSDEPQMQAVFQHAWNTGKSVYVPHLLEEYGKMEAAELREFQSLVRGRLNLLVPDPAQIVILSPEKIDLVVVPAVAYQSDGGRLGMGGGYYDRFLPKTTNSIRVGVCWDSHVVAELPDESHDQKVDFLLTETGIRSCRNSK